MHAAADTERAHLVDEPPAVTLPEADGIEMPGVVFAPVEGRQIEQALERRVIALSDFLPPRAPIPAIELSKGEKRLVKQPLDWGIYSGDAPYTVRFTAPDDSGLKVLSEVRVPDDKNDVEYEITAGDKTGEFKVTLKPSVGEPTVVTIRVR